MITLKLAIDICTWLKLKARALAEGKSTEDYVTDFLADKI